MAQNHLIPSNATKLADKVKYISHISQTNTMQQWIPSIKMNKSNKVKSKRSCEPIGQECLLHAKNRLDTSYSFEVI